MKSISNVTFFLNVLISSVSLVNSYLPPSRYLNFSVPLLILVLPGTCIKTGTLAPNYENESTIFLDSDCYLICLLNLFIP